MFRPRFRLHSPGARLGLRLPAALFGLSLLGSVACDDDETLPQRLDGPIDANLVDGREASVPDGREAGAEVLSDGPGAEAGSNPDGGVDGGDAGADGAAPAPTVAYAAVRFNADGTLDTTFGTAGIARIPLGTGANALGDPAVYGLAKDAANNLFLFGVKRHATRSDQERAVVKLTENGQLDTTFGTMGFTTFGIMNLNDNVRNGAVSLADGKILSAGYTAQPTGVGDQSVNRILLARLLPTGALDPAFGVGGLVNSAPFMPGMPDTMLWGMAEAYGVAIQPNGGYVTTGYGWRMPAPPPATSTPVDMVAFRYNPDGTRDRTFGGTADGSVTVNLPANGNDRGRNVIALPDNRVWIVGTGTVSGTGTSAIEDAMAVMLSPTGTPDTAFYAPNGYKLYDFMAADEEFFGVALSPNGNWGLATGYRSGAAGEDDDATVLLQPLASGVGAEVAKPLPLSPAANDRFWAAAFDAGNRPYGAGYVQQGTDRQMAVARFDTAGNLDTTFNGTGIATINVAAAGTIEAARGIVVQSNGKIVIAGPVEVP